MRRRVRETFVLGAERLADEAELDLRNEAEVDHEPKSELDLTAPAEPAILLPQEAAGPPAGAGDWRAKASASPRLPWRPRPPLAALVFAGATVFAALLLLRGGEDEQRGSRHLTDARAPVASPPAVADEGRAQGRGGHRDLPENPRSPQRSSARSDAAAKRADRRKPRELTPPAAIGEEPVYAEAPEPQPASPAAQPPPLPAAAPHSPTPLEPVQSATSVREEFGP